MKPPTTIVGFGLAGALVALELVKRGESVRIIDAPLPGAASPVGPGLINPLGTRRFRVGWNLQESLPEALATYRRLEESSGETLFHARPILRILKDAEQAKDLEVRRSEPELASWIRTPTAAEQRCLEAQLWTPFGAFVTEGGGWLDVPGFLAAGRRVLRADSRVVWNAANENALQFPLQPNDLDAAGAVVWCEGWRSRKNPLWKDLDHNPAKGEWMRIRLEPPLEVDAIVNGPCWIQPLPDGTARVGATYAWSSFEAGPSADAQATLIKNLAATFSGSFSILSQHVGVRPIVRDTRPVVGQHPSHSAHWILNGLASKGALYGPWAARTLVAAMLDGVPIPPDADVRRFFR